LPPAVVFTGPYIFIVPDVSPPEGIVVGVKGIYVVAALLRIVVVALVPKVLLR